MGPLLFLPPAPLQDTVGQASWLQTQSTHLEGVTGLKAAFPVHYEACRCGHMSGEQVGGWVCWVGGWVGRWVGGVDMQECVCV
jgi:hypothetical protein